jgi:hypothetical protein
VHAKPFAQFFAGEKILLLEKEAPSELRDTMQGELFSIFSDEYNSLLKVINLEAFSFQKYINE